MPLFSGSGAEVSVCDKYFPIVGIQDTEGISCSDSGKDIDSIIFPQGSWGFERRTRTDTTMDKDPSTPKSAELPRSQRSAKRQIQSRIAELEQANESLKDEITQHKRTADELTLLLRIAQELGSANDFLSSFDVGLRTICRATGWACGEVWLPSPDGTALECRHACCGELNSLERFNDLSRDFRFSPEVGLPGRVWASKQPEWVPDVSIEPEDKFPRRRLAKDFGLKSALGVPVLANNKILAVLVFFMSESREKDNRLIEIVSSAAAQLGMTLQHIQDDQTLREHRSLLQAIMDNSTSIIWFKDRLGRFQFVNREFEQRFHVCRENVRGMTDYDLFPGHIAQEFRANDLKVIEAGVPMDFEECAPQESSAHTYISNKFPLRDEDGKVYAVCGIATDITERKLEERSLELRVEAKTAELREASNFNQAIMASMGEGLYTIDTQGLVTYINPAAEQLFGWSSAELLGRKMHDVTHYQHPDGRPFPAHECAGLQVLLKGTALTDHEDVFIRKDGTFFPVVYSSSPITSDRGIVGLVVVFRDITARKQGQEARRRSGEALRALAARLQAAREEEKAILAREIHDELSGALTALKMDLSLVPDRASKDLSLFLDKLDSMSTLLDNTLDRVHSIVAGLRPIVLDKFGLLAAIEWQAQDFQERSGIACETHLPAADMLLDPARSTAIFRILQEALTNVARHAHATKVVVDLRSEAGSLILTVHDNGKGIDEKAIYAHDSMGLLGMRERALSFGGTAEVSRLTQGGTRVTARIPTGA
jgi:PAS domain S-box-containing protein